MKSMQATACYDWKQSFATLFLSARPPVASISECYSKVFDAAWLQIHLFLLLDHK